MSVLAVPLWRSVEFLGAIGAPSTRDQALDWIGAHVPDGRRVLTSVERFGLDRGKVEVLSSGPLRPDQRLQALHFDYVVVGTEDAPLALEGLKLEYHARAANRFSGTDVRVFSVPPPLRPRYRAVEPRPEALRASVHDDSVVRAVDGRLDTSWDSRRPQRAGDWIEARWAQAVRVARIEIRLDADPRREGRALSVLAQDVEGGAWREVPTFAGRPHVEDQGPSPDGFSQILILPPTRALAFRLVLTRDAAHRWAASEIRFDDVEGAGGEP